MFGSLIVWYLYLGGAGAAMEGILCCLDLAFGAAPMSEAQACGWRRGMSRAFLSRGHVLAFAALLLGVLFLVFDLGRPERFFMVFVFPTVSVLTFGAISLGVSIVCSAALAVISSFSLPRIPLRAVHTVECLGIASSVTTTLYTGVLLAQMEPMILWNPALPTLMACSAFSVGLAGIACCACGRDAGVRCLFDALHRFGLLSAMVEAVFLAVYCAVAATSDAALFSKFVLGDGSGVLWMGFVLPGLVAPAILEVARRATGLRVFSYIGVPLVLVAGLFLRYCVVNAPIL